jgi:hypothetical protein
MASKLPGPPAPSASCAQRPAEKTTRLCTGAKSMTSMDMTVITDFTIGLKVSVAEADLYLHWVSDLLTHAKDEDDGND